MIQLLLSFTRDDAIWVRLFVFEMKNLSNVAICFHVCYGLVLLVLYRCQTAGIHSAQCEMRCCSSQCSILSLDH